MSEGSNVSDRAVSAVAGLLAAVAVVKIFKKWVRRHGSAVPQEAAPTIKRVETELDRFKVRERHMASRFGMLTAGVAVVGIAFLTYMGQTGFHSITNQAEELFVSDTEVIAETAYLLIRGSGLAAIVGALVYFLTNLTRSAIDQSTRYEKRYIATMVIDYALHSPEVDPDRLNAAYNIIDAWGGTVESAYTTPRVAKQVSGYRYRVGKDSASVEEGTSTG